MCEFIDGVSALLTPLENNALFVPTRVINSQEVVKPDVAACRDGMLWENCTWVLDTAAAVPPPQLVYNPDIKFWRLKADHR